MTLKEYQDKFTLIDPETIAILSKFYDLKEIEDDLIELENDCYTSYQDDLNSLIQSDICLDIHSLDEILSWIYSCKISYAYDLKNLGKSHFYDLENLNNYRTATGEHFENCIDFEKYAKDILQNCYYTYFTASNGSLILIGM